MSYREPAAPGPPVVVRYWPSSPITIVVTAVVTLGVALVMRRSVPPSVSFGMAALAVVLPSLMLAFHARVEIDPTARTVRLVRAPWPLRVGARVFPIGSVRDAIVESEVDDGIRYRVSLVVEGEAPVPLYEGLWAPGEKRHLAIAAAIRALLPVQSGTGHAEPGRA